MRLSQFILGNMEGILQQWEEFARSLESGQSLATRELRDDAERMLRFVAEDMESRQTREEQAAKSMGHGPAPLAGQPSAAQDHGLARAADHFSLIELVSEYRALRASVIRMWIDAVPATRESIDEIVRFNEAIDQLLAEGIAKFTERLDRDADLFTASVGHDLSNPVNAIAMSALLLAANRDLSPRDRDAVARIDRSVSRLSGMLVDLRDFTRGRLGGFIRLEREACDVGTVARNVVDELAPVHPDSRVTVEASGDLVARVDAKRVTQVLSNLVANALQHGPARSEVTIRAGGDGDHVDIEVHNTGRAIESGRLKTLFDPRNRTATDASDARLGLGLYIARQIVLAHQGTIEVTSTETEGTSFRVRLPREAGADVHAFTG